MRARIGNLSSTMLQAARSCWVNLAPLPQSKRAISLRRAKTTLTSLPRCSDSSVNPHAAAILRSSKVLPAHSQIIKNNTMKTINSIFIVALLIFSLNVNAQNNNIKANRYLLESHLYFVLVNGIFILLWCANNCAGILMKRATVFYIRKIEIILVFILICSQNIYFHFVIVYNKLPS